MKLSTRPVMSHVLGFAALVICIVTITLPGRTQAFFFPRMLTATSGLNVKCIRAQRTAVCAGSLCTAKNTACGRGLFASSCSARASLGATGRLAAAREDCKSCKEQELSEEERRVGKVAMWTQEDEDALQSRRAELQEANRQEKLRNVKIAVGSFLSSVGLFFLQHSVIAPAQANPVVLLRAMEMSSSPLATALTNGRPTVVDFYADWCENCKAMAPSMEQIEEQFRNQVNFVVIDGSAEKNYDLYLLLLQLSSVAAMEETEVDAFRVDGIPHLAMVNSKGDIETAIIGAVPKEVIVDDIKALVAGKDLPYKGFDMFEGEDHNIKGQVEIDG